MAILESVLSLRELAGRLSLIQRWNGRTTTPWSVLHHTILALSLVPDGSFRDPLRLHVLLHDTAEAYIGDIPHGFKVPEQADFEEEILAEIYEGLGLVYSKHPGLRYIDDLTAAVEAQCIVHPATRRAVFSRYKHKYSTPTKDTVKGENTLWELLDLPRVEAVNWWVKTTEVLIYHHTEIPGEERV